MSARRIFVVPPAWPQPPVGWTPPPGWQPDPAWGPAPNGWEFWQQPNIERRPRPTVIALGGVAGLLVLGGIAAAVTSSDTEPVRAAKPAVALSPSPTASGATSPPPSQDAVDSSPQPAVVASATTKPKPNLDDAAVSACSTYALTIRDVVTKQDRSNVARVVNVHARRSSEQQIVDAGQMLTDRADSFTGFLWFAAKANFEDVCLRGGIRDAISRGGSDSSLPDAGADGSGGDEYFPVDGADQAPEPEEGPAAGQADPPEPEPEPEPVPVPVPEAEPTAEPEQPAEPEPTDLQPEPSQDVLPEPVSSD